MSEVSSSECAPWNFSWIVPNELAGMAWPQTPANLRFLESQGIKHLVTLSPEKRPPIHAFPGFKWTEIPIEEFEPPKLCQMRKFIDLCQKSRTKNELLYVCYKSVGIHCRMGRGRTGVMAACYLVHFLDQPPERAIINIRLMRPGSVETYEQEKAVVAYHDYLRRTKS
uniref:Dual specificity protein phosphatase 23 n=1 Tax=Timema californicum TaxID=61474 RepID=A0A7R9P3Q5_TIMCA|nr:unnamed protein product [Timema californicum]